MDRQQLAYISAICDKYPPLTKTAEEQLFKAYNAGDKRAANKLVLHHTRLALKTATTFAKFGAPIEDCFSAACLGIAKAVPKYDSSRGCRFVTAAQLYAVDEVVTFLEQSAAAVRIPSHIKLRTMLWTRKKLDELYGVDEPNQHPAAQALVKKSGLTEESFKQTAALLAAPLSLEHQTRASADGETRPFLDQIAGAPPSQETGLVDAEFKRGVLKAINTVLATKSERSRDMFVQVHLSEPPASVSDLAEKYDVTPWAIRKMNHSIMSRIRSELDKANIGEPEEASDLQLGHWQAPAPSFG